MEIRKTKYETLNEYEMRISKREALSGLCDVLDFKFRILDFLRIAIFGFGILHENS
mgnify:CR=1 FL=1